MMRQLDRFDFVRDVTADDILTVGNHMRTEDIRELAAEGLTDLPLDVLRNSVELSDEVYTGCTDGKKDTPVIIFGITDRYKNVTGYSSVWLLGTRCLYNPKIKSPFIRYSRLWVDYFLKRYGVIGNEVHAGNHASLSWLNWCGFQKATSYRHLLTGELFYTMVKQMNRS